MTLFSLQFVQTVRICVALNMFSVLTSPIKPVNSLLNTNLTSCEDVGRDLSLPAELFLCKYITDINLV